jgi:hypothetical protein
MFGIGTPKRRKNSSISSSICHHLPGPLDDTFSSVRIFTTEGPTCSTKSVKSGSPRTWENAGDAGTKAADSRHAPSRRRQHRPQAFQFN